MGKQTAQAKKVYYESSLKVIRGPIGGPGSCYNNSVKMAAAKIIRKKENIITAIKVYISHHLLPVLCLFTVLKHLNAF